MQRQRQEERESFQQAQRQYSSLPRYEHPTRTPPRVAILPVLVPWEIPPPQCTFSNNEEPHIDGGNHRLLRGRLTTWQGDPEGGVLGDAHTFTRQLPHWT